VVLLRRPHVGVNPQRRTRHRVTQSWRCGHASPQTVEATTLHHDDNLVDVTLAVTTTATSAQANGAAATPAAKPTTRTTPTHDEVVHTTANHPWLSADHGWLIASFLHVGEPVQQADGRVATVVSVRSVPGAADKWDLTVSQVHTFAVGSGAYVVHNCGLDGMPDATKLGDGQDYYYKGERRDELTKANGWTKDDKTSAIGPNESQPFRDFIKSRRDPGYVFNDGDWQYHMETWNHEGGGTFYNHYWKNIWEGVGEDNVWHHH
jgi:hypothetical protein